MVRAAMKVSVALIAMSYFLSAGAVHAEMAAAPAAMQTAVLLKLLVFNKQIAATDSVAIHVVGSDEVAEAFGKAIGTKIGTGVLARVTSGDGLPTGGKVHVVYLGNADKADAVFAYTRERDVLSVSGVPAAAQKGTTLGVGIEKQRVRVFFNPESSREEGATWESGLMKVVAGE
jgi:hypothetical protein